MPIINVSKPTRQQVKHGLERVLGVFVVAFVGVLQSTPDSFNKTTLTAAGLAGVTALYQLLLSSLTNL